MKISIAMATYNGEAFIRAQLDSFIFQTRRPDELVIADDLSSDNTVAIAQDFAKSAPFSVRIERNPRRLGITENFSKALSLCTGELVMLSDQDDFWLPEKIATLEAVAASNKDRACFVNDALLTDEELRPSGATKRGQIVANGMPETSMVMGCCTMFRRDLLDLLLPIPQDPQGFDGWLVHFSDLLGKTKHLDVPLQLYRRHDNNASNIFVNQIKPLSRSDVLRRKILGLPRKFSSADGLNNEHQFYSLVANRMAQRKTDVSKLVGEVFAVCVLAAAETRASLLARRREIRNVPVWQRLPAVWALFRSGGYRESGKLSGALKDLLVRAQRCTEPP